ncbi:MAG: flagellar protein FlgN [Acidobacteriia bacterium]|nr:flagellar protein FlgN [Terriglobia bacterium]
MEEQIAALMNIVREEIALYRDLIDHARRKTALLVRGPLEAILESNKIDETFNVKLRLLENEVARLCQQLCQALHIAREEFTLLKLADGVEQSVAAEIRSQSTLFKHMVDQLKSVNQRNRKLVENSLHYSHGLLDFISNATSSYQSTGLFKPYSAVANTISDKA